MKNKCLQLFFGVSLLFVLVFLSVKNANAVTTIFIDQPNGTLAPNCAGIGGCQQTFKATASNNNNVNRISVYTNGGVGTGDIYLKLCHVASISSNTCLDTPRISDNAHNLNPQTLWSDFDFASSTPYITVAGEYYMFEFYSTAESVGGINIEVYTPDPYADGYLLANSAYDMGFKVYYDSSYLPGVNNPYLDMSLFFFDNPYTCYVNSTCKIRYNYNQLLFSQYDYIEIFQWSDNYTASTSLGTTTIIEPNGFLQDKTNGLSNFILENAATSTKYIFYDVVAHLAAYYDVNSGQDIAATTTIPYVVSVLWQGQPDVNTVLNGIEAIATNTPTSTLMGMSAHDLACSPDEWASTTNQYFNSCLISEIGIKIMLQITTVSNKAADLAIKFAQRVFPFNIPTKIYQSWKASAYRTVPAELSWLNQSETNGDINITLPTALNGTTSTSSVNIWGPTLASSSTEFGTDLAGVRAISPYIMALLFFIGLYFTAEYVYSLTHEIK